MRTTLKPFVLLIGLTILCIPIQARAANWLILQGTESGPTPPRAKLWGFIQPVYQYTKGTRLAAGPWKGQRPQFNLIGPQLKSNGQFNLQRARIGVRGRGFPENAKIDYFLLAEFGSNGITWPNGGFGAVRLTDASVTLSYIPGARIRAGLFKTPGPEEGLQAIHVFDYINFTTGMNQLMLERYFNTDGSGTFAAPGTPPRSNGNPNAPTGPIGAFRSLGVQVFDSFMVDTWDISYALMVGNGTAINGGDSIGRVDGYGYLSAEKVFAGKGPRRQGLKGFAWGQFGQRRLRLESKNKFKRFDRGRYGVGFTFRKSIWRATGEFLIADGMIFNGTDGGGRVGSKSNPVGPPASQMVIPASFNVEPRERAHSYVLHVGVQVMKQLEIDLRFDVLNRATKVAAKQRNFQTLTLGSQWFFDKKNRVALNYEARFANAPNLPEDSNANLILDGMDHRIALQVTAIF